MKNFYNCQGENIFSLNTEQMSVGLLKEAEGFSLSAIYDTKTNTVLFNGQKPLFTLSARRLSNDELIEVNSDKGWENVEFISQSNGAVIIFSSNSTLPDVSVILNARCSGKRISWTVQLTSTSDEYTLHSCDYPALSFNSNEDILFMTPYGCGELHNSTIDEYKSVQNYPSYGVSMQLFTFYNTKTKRGIYYSTHDSAPAYKKFSAVKVKGENCVTLKATQPLVNIGAPRNSQSLYGYLVWEIYDGDWYDAAMLHREWFEKSAQWKPEQSGCARKDIPEWFKKNTHWWLVRIKDDEQYVDDILKANEDLGINSAVHLYDWFQIPYDNDYPHYFPTKPVFDSGTKKLLEKGVKIMPYINGRLWDTRDKGMEDYQFSSHAKPNCTKDNKGEPFIETYNSKEIDGSSVKLSIMCPSTALWQEKVQSLVSKLLNEYGMNAVYIDQIAAASPYLCEDKTHTHLPGGGSWWCESYNNLLDHVEKIKPENTMVTSECTADPFMKHIQGYLSWLWIDNNQVPAFQAIYSGYIPVFGRSYGSVPADDDSSQRLFIAESLVFGEQLGWIDPHRYLAMQSKDFYKKCVKFRSDYGEFFYNGTLQRPPFISGDIPVIEKSEIDDEKYNQHVGQKLVHSQIWRREDGKLLFILVNGAKRSVKVDIAADFGKENLKLEGDLSCEVKLSNGKMSLELPALSLTYAVI